MIAPLRLSFWERDLWTALEFHDAFTRALAVELLVKEQARDRRGRWAGGGDGGPPPALFLGLDVSPSGPRGGGEGGGSPAEQLHSDEKTIRSVFSYHDEQTGLTVEVKSIINRNGRNGDTRVALTVKDRDGAVVGGVNRIVRPAEQHTVHADGMILAKPLQGQGFAARYDQHTEAGYRAHGITKVTAEFNIDVGGYAGARKGYDFADPASREKVARKFRQYKAWPGSELQAQLDRLAADPHTTPIEFAMAGHTEGATDWFGKDRMLGSSWNGEKAL